MNLLKKLFFKQMAAKTRPNIERGQKWVLVVDKGPWEPVAHPPVTILDVKDGWVRYRMNSAFPDCRNPVDTFLSMYSPHEELPADPELGR